MRYRVTNLTRNTLLADRAARADTFVSRFRGLMGRPELPLGDGLQIDPCTSIHTFFMKIPIDALFLDRSLQVVDVCHAMPPWRMSRVYFGAQSVLELPAGTAAASGTQVGDRLAFEPFEVAPQTKPG
jgi:uncharacterized membrane protein (UPF0127 family)